MAQDFSSVAIIGGGPAGVMTAALLCKEDLNIKIFEPKRLLATIPPTGGGKCNITHKEYDFKVFSSNYPRGEKFLYSIFSRYCMPETVEYFEKIGIKTVSHSDGRIFPIEMSSEFVREKLIEQISGVNVIKERVFDIRLNGSKFLINTGNSNMEFDAVVVATGGHCDFSILKTLGIKIIPPRPALTGLCTNEHFEQLSGIVLKDIYNRETGLKGNLLFTHFGVSGPLIFKISSLKARDKFPYTLCFNFIAPHIVNVIEFQKILNRNPHKEIKNIISGYLPINFVKFLLKSGNINPDIQGCKINGSLRDKIFELFSNYKMTVKSPRSDGETVMSGGVDLKQINPKTLECKNIPNLYFAGEVLDIDGFCGGFNLQNCWSSAFVISDAFSK